jgi:hypothetical protein
MPKCELKCAPAQPSSRPVVSTDHMGESSKHSDLVTLQVAPPSWLWRNMSIAMLFENCADNAASSTNASVVTDLKIVWHQATGASAYIYQSSLC